MIKLSASANDGDEFAHSELSRGGYVTSDEKLELSNYLVNLPSQNDVRMEMDVEYLLNQSGNGGDLDDYGDDARDFYDTMREVELGRLCVLLGYDGIDQDDEGGMNSMLLHVGETMDPDEVKVPKPPNYWVEPAPNTAKGVHILKK